MGTSKRSPTRERSRDQAIKKACCDGRNIWQKHQPKLKKKGAAKFRGGSSEWGLEMVTKFINKEPKKVRKPMAARGEKKNFQKKECAEKEGRRFPTKI